MSGSDKITRIARVVRDTNIDGQDVINVLIEGGLAKSYTISDISVDMFLDEHGEGNIMNFYNYLKYLERLDYTIRFW